MPHFKSISFAGAPHPVALKFADGDSLFERVNEMDERRGARGDRV